MYNSMVLKMGLPLTGDQGDQKIENDMILNITNFSRLALETNVYANRLGESTF